MFLLPQLWLTICLARQSRQMAGRAGLPGTVLTCGHSDLQSMGAPHIPGRTVLFQRERTGLTYRVPALLLVPPGPTLLAFAEQRLSPSDSHGHRLVLRRGTLAGGSVQVSGQHRSVGS